ncbi:MAG: choice-of-anchor V domain-containing protein [Bacteroidia bacterium]
MNKLYAVCSLAIVLMVGLGSNLISRSAGAPAGRSGSPIDAGTCHAAGCHISGTAVNGGPGSVSITTDIPAEGFIAGQSYEITVTVEEGGKSRFGFEASVYGENTNKTAGTTVISDMARTQALNSGGNTWVTHRFNGITSVDQNSFSFNWTADANNDSVTIYAVGLAANANGNNSGDLVYSTNAGAARQFGVSVDEPLTLVELQAYPSPATDRLQVEFNSTVFGEGVISLVDMQGREVYRFEDDLVPGPFRHTIDVSNLNSGIYNLRASLNGKNKIKKVIVN